MFVLTVDQRRSRRDIDRVPDLLDRYAERSLIRPFDRTAGDEVQAVSDDPNLVVDIALDLVDDGSWSVGIGAGATEQPLPDITRAGRGEAFEAARDAVTRAKTAPGAIAVSGPSDDTAADAQAVLTLLAVLITRRSDEGRSATATMRTATSQAVAAAELGITRQAMSQRLAVAGWQAELSGRNAAVRLLARADGGVS
ncbi:hypothetical protein GCM10007304_24910 [Rhodococcoides trifolii]|uniref:DNA-binding protein n=1 Tax=Rhodococcoides trifolii TaxID=908250 RepID=A0A917FUF4_9NOCA|nr:hypothetical protein [Rhodococcus trifolii]GGG09849.1 hypothetical protein GCM10007304_24910 [Rhodococcus trifolii]